MSVIVADTPDQSGFHITPPPPDKEALWESHPASHDSRLIPERFPSVYILRSRVPRWTGPLGGAAFSLNTLAIVRS